MNIVDIREEPELIGILSEYHQKEWGHLCPGESLDGRKNRMRLFLKDEFIPTMFLAKENASLY